MAVRFLTLLAQVFDVLTSIVVNFRVSADGHKAEVVDLNGMPAFAGRLGLFVVGTVQVTGLTIDIDEIQRMQSDTMQDGWRSGVRCRKRGLCLDLLVCRAFLGRFRSVLSHKTQCQPAKVTQLSRPMLFEPGMQQIKRRDGRKRQRNDRLPRQKHPRPVLLVVRALLVLPRPFHVI